MSTPTPMSYVSACVSQGEREKEDEGQGGYENGDSMFSLYLSSPAYQLFTR